MTKVSLHRMLNDITDSAEREFWVSEYVSWLILNIGPHRRLWWLDRNAVNGRTFAISFIEPDDALVFKLKFGL
jgi:hypothetical protein